MVAWSPRQWNVFGCWQVLGQLRVAQHERRERGLGATQSVAEPLDTMMQEEEAQEMALWENEEFNDPMQKLLCMQMQQLAMMQRQLQSKQLSDALRVALSGTSEGSSVMGAVSRVASPEKHS